MENGSGCIQHLKIVLNVESGEDIVGITYGEMRTVGVVRRFAVFGGCDDVREAFPVMFGEAVTR